MIVNQSLRNRLERLPILTTATCIWCVVVFLGFHLSDKQYSSLSKFGLYSMEALLHGKFWGLVTMAFVHVEPIHMIFNLYWMWILGGTFERRFGSLNLFAFIIPAAFISSGLQLATGHHGIGLSGVGYALFGFFWFARQQYPEFAVIVNDQVVRIFAIWGVICVALTQLNIMHIANVAHLGGFMFGALIGGILILPKSRVWTWIPLAAMAVGSVVPLFWNPMSPEWVVDQAAVAWETKDWGRATDMYKRYLALGGYDKSFAWTKLATLYEIQDDKEGYKLALSELRRVDSSRADEIVRRYGEPK